MPNFIQKVQMCNISHPNKLVFMFKDTFRTVIIIIIIIIIKHL